MGFEDTCDESMVTAVQDRVKKLCVKDNVLLKVLGESSEDLMNTYMNTLEQQKEMVSILMVTLEILSYFNRIPFFREIGGIQKSRSSLRLSLFSR